MMVRVGEWRDDVSPVVRRVNRTGVLSVAGGLAIGHDDRVRIDRVLDVRVCHCVGGVTDRDLFLRRACG
jgi:hypothetical protein